MLELIGNIDVALFFFINQSLANPVTDFIMPIVTSNDYLRIGYALVMAVVLFKGSVKTRWLVLFSLLTILIADQLTAGFLKNLFERPRPCHAFDELNLLVGCGSGYSMPSAHAANAFAQALLWGLQVRQARCYLHFLASLIALSRVFVGVHYLSDIIVGAFVGAVIGWMTFLLFKKFIQRTNLKVTADGDDN